MRFSTINKQVVQHFNLTSGDLAIGKPPNELEVAMTIVVTASNQKGVVKFVRAFFNLRLMRPIYPVYVFPRLEEPNGKRL